MRFRKSILLLFVGVSLLLLTTPFQAQGLSVHATHPHPRRSQLSEELEKVNLEDGQLIKPRGFQHAKRSLEGERFNLRVRKRSPIPAPVDGDPSSWNQIARSNAPSAKGSSVNKAKSKRSNANLDLTNFGPDRYHWDLFKGPVDSEGKKLTGADRDGVCTLMPRAACSPSEVPHSKMAASLDSDGELVYEDGSLVKKGAHGAGGHEAEGAPEEPLEATGLHIDANTNLIVDANGIPLRGKVLLQLANDSELLAKLAFAPTEPQPTDSHIGDHTDEPLDRDGKPLSGEPLLRFWEKYFGGKSSAGDVGDNDDDDGDSEDPSTPRSDNEEAKFYDQRNAIYILSSLKDVAPLEKGALGLCSCKRTPTDGLYGPPDKSCAIKFSLLGAPTAQCNYLDVSTMSCVETTAQKELHDGDIDWWKQNFCMRCQKAGGTSHPKLQCGDDSKPKAKTEDDGTGLLPAEPGAKPADKGGKIDPKPAPEPAPKEGAKTKPIKPQGQGEPKPEPKP